MRIVMAHLTRYGPSGVPNGCVDAQKRGKGRTPCLRIKVKVLIPLKKVGGQIPSTLTNHARLAEEHGKQIAKCAQRNKEVEASDGAARAKDLLKEQAGGYLRRVSKLRLRNC